MVTTSVIIAVIGAVIGLITLFWFVGTWNRLTKLNIETDRS